MTSTPTAFVNLFNKRMPLKVFESVGRLREHVLVQLVVTADLGGLRLDAGNLRPVHRTPSLPVGLLLLPEERPIRGDLLVAQGLWP